jgi:segregation and condensation protein A
MAYEIKLDIFEGPLDLLLYLIRKNEIDIYNIPIALITKQYLDYIEKMKALNLDLAGEYLVLASTLLHIKSRMLLPDDDLTADEAEGDPRNELVRQLLEYQIYKEAALSLDQRPILERDVYKTVAHIELIDDAQDDIPIELDLFDLVEAFKRIISTIDHADYLEMDMEKMSLTDKITEIMDRLSSEKSVTFADLIMEKSSRKAIVYTFLALLELMKLKMIKAYQTDAFGMIRIFPAVEY